LEQLKSLLVENKAWSQRELAYRLDISKGNVQRMLKKDLCLVKKFGNMDPAYFDPHPNPKGIAGGHSLQLSAYNIRILVLNSIIAIDETWVSMYDQSRLLGTPWGRSTENIQALAS
jgi:hypothetical protein